MTIYKLIESPEFKNVMKAIDEVRDTLNDDVQDIKMVAILDNFEANWTEEERINALTHFIITELRNWNLGMIEKKDSWKAITPLLDAQLVMEMIEEEKTENN